MEQSLISIIIPVYNTQEYIIDCLESVKKQTYKNYEVLIINDGSSDNSQELIINYIRSNGLDNFFLIEKANGGICSARNLGLEKASGKWIVFLDSDDWLEPTCLENMMKAEDKYHADFCLVGFRAYEIETGEFNIWSDYPVAYGVLPEELFLLKSFDYVWARMYKKTIIDEHALKFDEKIRFCEDNAFNFDYIGVINSFVCVNDIGYNYRRGHSGAISRSAITPYMRKNIGEHMYHFCDKLPQKCILDALKENRSFLCVMWNAQLTDVVIDILEKNKNRAKEKMRRPLAVAIVNTFTPSTKKDRLLHCLWKRSFFLFELFVKVFYNNIDKIKKVKWLSRFLTH
jgi:glycosyltransferase involved in cell wall biosynthesis